MLLKTVIVLVCFTVVTILAFKGSFTSNLAKFPRKSVDKLNLNGQGSLKLNTDFDYTINVTIGTPRKYLFEFFLISK